MLDLWDIAAIDQHAHNLLTPSAATHYPYPAAFTEGYDADIVNYHARHSLFYRRSLRDIAQLLECEPQEEAIVECRTQLGIEKLTRRCFEASKLQAIFLDDGFLPDEILPLEWHEQFVPVQRILRLEYLAQNLMSEIEDFQTFVERFRNEMQTHAHRQHIMQSIESGKQSGAHGTPTFFINGVFHDNGEGLWNAEALLAAIEEAADK